MKTQAKQLTKLGAGVTIKDLLIVLGVLSVIILAVQVGFWTGVIKHFDGINY